MQVEVMRSLLTSEQQQRERNEVKMWQCKPDKSNNPNANVYMDRNYLASKWTAYFNKTNSKWGEEWTDADDSQKSKRFKKMGRSLSSATTYDRRFNNEATLNWNLWNTLFNQRFLRCIRGCGYGGLEVWTISWKQSWINVLKVAESRMR